jgi:hypothetical protein
MHKKNGICIKTIEHALKICNNVILITQQSTLQAHSHFYSKQGYKPATLWIKQFNKILYCLYMN